jgi:hypothetical protein
MRPTIHSDAKDCTGYLKENKIRITNTIYPMTINYKQTQRIIGSKAMFVIVGKLPVFY